MDSEIKNYCQNFIGDSCDYMEPRVAEVSTALFIAGKPVINPFTGTVSVSQDSIGMHSFIVRESDKVALVISSRDISVCPSDRIWYFPEHDIVISIGYYDNFNQEVAICMQRALDSGVLVENYLNSKDRYIRVHEESMGHIGHYIWNVISGWERFLNTVPENVQFDIARYRLKHFFGGVADLYDQEIKKFGKLLTFENQEEATFDALKNNAVALVLRDRNPTRELSIRVLNWCRKAADASFLKNLDTLRARNKRMIMITLRFDNRAWVEQEEGYIALINQLAHGGRPLCVVIDGLNSMPEGTTTFVPMSIDEEIQCANRIIEACPGVNFLNTIGRPVFESILACDAIDWFVSPVGAGLAKLRWIANKPGLGFSNKTFMSPGHFEGYLYSNFREDLVPMDYVDISEITDADGGNHGMLSRANFHMDWKSIYERVPENIR